MSAQVYREACAELLCQPIPTALEQLEDNGCACCGSRLRRNLLRAAHRVPGLHAHTGTSCGLLGSQCCDSVRLEVSPSLRTDVH